MVRIIPDGVVLTKAKRDGDHLILTGIAESHSQVSVLMRRINESHWLSQARLSQIKEKKDRTEGQEFELELLVNKQPIAGAYDERSE